MKSANLILAISSFAFWMITCMDGKSQVQDNYYFKQFTIENGLPYNAIRTITQDQTGFLWIATWDGLSRYDGYEFKNYYHRPNDSTSLSFFAIEKVVVDRLNNVWVLMTEQIPLIYNRSKDNFYPAHKIPVYPRTYDLTTDPSGNVWLSWAQGLEKYNYTKNVFSHFDLFVEDSIKLNYDGLKPFISIDNQGNIWIFTLGNDFIKVYKSVFIGIDQVKFIQFKPLPIRIGNYQGSAYNYVQSFNVISQGKNVFWLFTNFGLVYKSITAGIFEEYKTKIRNDEFAGAPSFSAGFQGQIVNSYDDVHRVNNQIILNKPQLISSTFEDNQNTLWYSTLYLSGEGVGLTHAVKTPSFFKHYFFDQKNNGQQIACFPVLKSKNGDIWAGPRNLNALFHLKRNGQFFRCNELDPDTWNNVSHPHSLLEDSEGIWIGYYAHRLMYFDFKTNKFSTRIVNPKNLGTNTLPHSFTGLEWDNNDLIINGNSEIYRYNPKTGVIKLLWGNNFHDPVFCLRKDSNNCHWIGLQNSTIKYLNRNYEETASYVLCKNRYNVQDICIGDEDDLWIALLGGGIAHLNLKTGKTEFLTTADGLSNNTCYNILKDKSGKLWISTNHGISQYTPKSRQFKIFGSDDGLKVDEFNANASFQSCDGEMLFGGVGGVVGFYPDSLTESVEYLHKPPVVITDFKVSGIPRLFNKAVYDMDTVMLNKGDDNFQVSFACIDFKNGDNLKYRYKLTGADKEFKETDRQRRFVNYTNLGPGIYRIEIEATDQKGEWNSKTDLVILIPPHFYQVIWFKLSAVLVVLLILSGFIILYIRQIRLKASHEHAQLRLDSLRGQMNPHFIFNSLNSINYFISQNDRLSANRYIADFSRLIRNFLGNLSREYIPFESELETLKDYLQLEHLRFGEKFDYAFEIGADIDLDRTMVFPGMVQPFIENAIWHGVRGLANRKGFVTVKFLSGSEDYLKCIIEDDGIGRKLSEIRKNRMVGRKSKGIEIISERLRIINQFKVKKLRMDIEELYPDSEETGTIVTIEIPARAVYLLNQ